MTSEKIKITDDDLDMADKASVSPEGSYVATIPRWWKAISALLVFFPPLLFIAAIVQLLSTRTHRLETRYAYALHYCILLLSSGLIWLLVAGLLTAVAPRPLSNKHDGEKTALTISSFPALPSDKILSAREIAQQLLPSVAIVHHPSRSVFRLPSGPRSIGAAVLLAAKSDSCVFLTSEHVVTAIARRTGLGGEVGLTLYDGQYASARVMAIHKTLDLALLRASRDPSGHDFLHPIRPFQSIAVGESVFAIGHPVMLEFSIAGGLVAQVRGADILQLSVPISPGNSGGPVFDGHGQLVAIVESSIDKSRTPQAEVLNFAVRADAVMQHDAWFLNEGDSELFLDLNGAMTSLIDKKREDGTL